MKLDDFYLEVTRECTLLCEHCLRGEKEAKSMSVETLENALKDITYIKTLLLSGGEPLLNIKVLESLPELLKKYSIQVDRIGIITNGTIISSRHIQALQKLKSCCSSFQFFLSNDPFHHLEWKRLGIEDKVEENFKTYEKLFSMKKYPERTSFATLSYISKGKAKSISEDLLHSIEHNSYLQIKMNKEEQPKPIILYNDSVEGKICIDVHGNLVGFSKTYKEEDEESSLLFNVNKRSLWEIIPSYLDKQNAKSKKYF